MKKNAVRDELGRQRFHGAFTGGFSAGYFNTVGSEEGFRPQTFHSSRSNRAEKKQQTARDFMDEEDGLLGGNLTTKKELDSFLPDHARAPTKSVLDVDFDEFKDEENSKAVRMLLSNLVLEPTNTMGKRILGQMGWKPGMAVGPRVKKSEYSSIPIETRNISTKGIQEGTLTFALREEKSFFDLFPQPKTDTTGIGYVKDGLQDELFDNQGEDEEANRYRVTDLFQKNSTSGSLLKGVNEKKPKRKTGSSFLADDDDDIAYDNSFDNYSTTAFEIEDDTGLSITKKKQSKDKLSDYIQESRKEQAAEIYRCPSDNRPPLKGFHVALKETQIIQPFYPPPTDIPKDFKPFHVFQVQEEPLTTLSGKKSIFDYLKPEDRQRLLGLAAKQQQRQVSTSLTNSTTSSIPPTVGEPAPSVVNTVDSITNENSIFNLIKPQDRNRILGLAQQIKSSSGNQMQSTADPISIPPPPLPPAIPPPPLPLAIPPPPLPPAENNFFTRFQRPDNVQPIEQSTSNGSDSRPMLVPTHRLNSTFAGLSEAFKNRFTNSSSNTNAEKNPLEPKSVDENVLKEGLTSAEEFAKLLKEKQEKEANKNSSSAPATTESSSSTRTTKKLINRTTILWTPNSLLCKRCHIRPSDTAAPNNMPPPSSSSVSFTTTSASTSTNVNATGFSLEKDPLFSRLFSTGTNNNNDPMNKEREAEIKANLEKERIENEKALQKLIQEFDLYDIYQSSVGEKPDSHVYEIIFNEKDENEILTNENETKEIEKRMREEEEQLLIASEKINSQKNEEISINLSKQIAESVAGMPKFIPKSKRKLNSTEESISSSSTTTSSAVKFGSSSGYISASSTHKRPLVPENPEERELKPKTSSSLRSFADTPPPPPTVQDQDKPIPKKIKKKVRYQEDAINDQVDEDEQEEIRKLEEASRLLLGESVVDDDDGKAGKLLNIAAESSRVHENEFNEKRESSSIPIALDDDDLFGRPISSMKSLVNVAGDANDTDDNIGGAIVFKKKRTKK